MHKLWLKLREYGLIGFTVLALAGGVLFLILRKAFASNKTSEGTQDLINVINEAKNDIQIARTETAVKIAAARTEETEVRKQINEISKVKDKKKRLEALIQLEKSL